jgi:hypothetical protein
MSSASCCLPFSLRSVLERCHLFCVFMSSALRCGSLLASARSQGDVSALFCLPRPASTISSTSVLFFALGPALSLRWISAVMWFTFGCFPPLSFAPRISLSILDTRPGTDAPFAALSFRELHACHCQPMQYPFSLTRLTAPLCSTASYLRSASFELAVV